MDKISGPVIWCFKHYLAKFRLNNAGHGVKNFHFLFT